MAIFHANPDKELVIKNGWIPGLDGLRALAVFFVLIHHYNVDLIDKWALGNTGVAIFYCLSGFLVYTVLDRDQQQYGGISYERYLRRRALRIWPLYFTVVVTTLLFIITLTSQSVSINSIIPLFLFSMDFQLAHWQEWPPLGILSPLWSIAVEEQFYVLAPILYKMIHSRFRWVGICIIFISANLIRAYIAINETHLGNGGLYYLPYTYMDLFVAGALLACVRLKKITPNFLKTGISLPKDIIYTLITVGLLLVVMRLWGLSIFRPYKDYTLIPYALLPLMAVLIINLVATGDRLGITWLLSQKSLRILGVLSYGAYLVHLPIYYLFDIYLEKPGTITHHGLQENIAAISLVFVTAAILNWSIERPFLKIKQRPFVQQGDEKISGPNLPWITIISVGLVLSGVIYSYIRLP